MKKIKAVKVVKPQTQTVKTSMKKASKSVGYKMPAVSMSSVKQMKKCM